MVVSYSFHAEQAGPRLLVTGAVHGNEICGARAIPDFVRDFESGRRKLLRGSVTFIPVCNPGAHAADVRYLERNLNRFLVPQEKPDCYEARLGNILCSYLERCDYLLDLHSYTVGGAPFIYAGPPDEVERAYARALGAEAMVFGWQSSYAASGVAQRPVSREESTGTTEYSRRFGAKAVTLECGGHREPHSVEVARRAIGLALNYLEVAEHDPAFVAPRGDLPLIEAKRVFFRKGGGAFTKAWKNFEAVRAGEVIARDGDGTELAAPGDGVLILPHADTADGTEWFYWGQTCA
jgi:predicted deacylase